MLRGLLQTVLLVLVVGFLAPAPLRAADPTPTISPDPSPVLIDPLDPRAGEGASRVGAPFAALVAVITFGIIAAAGTAFVVTLAGRR